MKSQKNNNSILSILIHVRQIRSNKSFKTVLRFLIEALETEIKTFYDYLQIDAMKIDIKKMDMQIRINTKIYETT